MKKIIDSLRKLKKDVKGFSLVELICVIAILGIVGLAVGGFIVYSTSGFNDSVNEIDLQYESQQTINQIKNLVMDANKGVGMVTPADPDENPYFVAYSMGRAANDEGTMCDSFEVVKIEYDAASKQLKYGTKDYLIPEAAQYDAVLSTIHEASIVTDSVLAKNVSSFSVDTTELVTAKTIKLNISFANKSSSYSNSSIITLRNKVYESTSARVAFSTTGILKSRYVTSVSIEKYGTEFVGTGTYSGSEVKIATIKRPRKTGSTPSHEVYSFTAYVDAEGMSKEVKWELEGSVSEASGDASTVNEDTGEVSISSHETSRYLKLTATSRADEDKKDEIYINVKWIYTNNVAWYLVSRGVTVDSNNICKERFGFPKSNDDIITYAGGPVTDLENDEKGFEVKFYRQSDGVELSSAQGFNWNKDTGILECTQAASGVPFNVVVKSNCPKEDGTDYTLTIPYTVSRLADSGGGYYSLGWNGDVVDKVNRGEAVSKRIECNNFDGTSYTFSIDYIGDWTETEKSKVHIPAGISGATVTVNVDTGLTFDKSFKFRIKADVTGQVDSDGSLINVSASSYSEVFEIDSVSFEFSGFPSATVLDRDTEATQVTYTLTGIVNVTPTFAVVENGNWGGESGKVTFTNGVLKVGHSLNWHTEYKFSLKLTVKAGDQEIVKNSHTYTVPQVDFYIIQTDYRNTKTATGGFFSSDTYKTNLSYNFGISGVSVRSGNIKLNLTIDSTGVWWSSHTKNVNDINIPSTSGGFSYEVTGITGQPKKVYYDVSVKMNDGTEYTLKWFKNNASTSYNID